MVTKKDIRKHVLKIRDSITKVEWENKSLEISKKVIAHSFFLESNIIYCYINYLSEVETRSIIESAWNTGKIVAVPKVSGQDLTFHMIESFDDLVEGYKGILEPITKEIDTMEPGLVIVPGVAFDTMRNRIGYGKGFYDRFLSKNPHLKTIAIAFEKQLISSIQTEEFDFKPEVLITEEHIYV